MDTIIYRPSGGGERQVELFARKVASAAREAVDKARGGAGFAGEFAKRG